MANRISSGDGGEEQMLNVIFACAILVYWFTQFVLPPAAVNEKAVKLNETLGTQDKGFERHLPELQKEIDHMMKELRRKNLETQKEVAEDELVWVRALWHFHI